MLKALLNVPEHRRVTLYLTLFIVALFFRFWDSDSADLMASWLAGHFLHNGQPDAVFTGLTGAFQLEPHPDWIPLLEGEGYVGPVYPFIYPPLWAWLVGHLDTLQSFWLFMIAMTFVNACLMAGIIYLAWKAARTEIPASVWILICIALFSLTSIGMLAMKQNQPHILVTFLLVATIERSRAGAQTTAGIALAIAASIKLFPALFVLAFLVLGQRRAFVSFVIAGAALAGASVAVAGWPLHQAFLAEARHISETILVRSMSFNLHSSFAQLFFADALTSSKTFLVGMEENPMERSFFIEAGPLAIVAARAALVTSMIYSLWLLRVCDDQTRYGVAWPLMITLVAITSPLSWSFYFIISLAFLPVLLERLGKREGRLAIALIIIPIASPVVGVYAGSMWVANSVQLVGTLSMAGLTVAFISALKPADVQLVSCNTTAAGHGHLQTTRTL